MQHALGDAYQFKIGGRLKSNRWLKMKRINIPNETKSRHTEVACVSQKQREKMITDKNKSREINFTPRDAVKLGTVLRVYVENNNIII